MEKEGLSKEEKLKEQIRFMVEWLKILAAFLTVTLGSTISIILEGDMGGGRIFFSVMGVFFSTIFPSVGSKISFKIRKMIRV